MSDIERISAVARKLLVLPGASQPDEWLWEHTQRVVDLAGMISVLPEVGDERPDAVTVTLAALFHDVGWATQVHAGQVKSWQVLSRPTSDLQREYGAAALLEHGAGLFSAELVDLAAEAIRQCNDRTTGLPEAIVLAEAENLDDIGVMYVLRQIRHAQGDGRPLQQFVQTWNRQLEYRYWDARINDCLRFPTPREIARQRIQAVEAFLSALARDRESADFRQLLRARGIQPPPLA